MQTQDEHVSVPVSDAELQRRWGVVRKVMEENGLSALVLQNSNDWLGGYVRWFTGTPAHNAYPRSVIFFLNRPMTIVEQGSFNSHRRVSEGDKSLRGVADWFGTPSYSSISYTTEYDADIIIRELEGNGAKKIGMVNPGGMYFPFGRKIQQKFGYQVVDFTDPIDKLKAIKSEEEIALIRNTTALQDEVIRRVKEFATPGMKDYELTGFAQHTAQSLGSEQGIFLGSSAPAGRASLFRGRHGQGRTIQKGDCFTLLVEVNGPGGFYTEIARSFNFGPAPTVLKDNLAAMIEAQQNTLKYLVPGASCREIFQEHNAYMRARGFKEENRLHCHGQGYDMVERPLVRFDEDMTIAKGMSIVVHPSVMTDEAFVTVCDNYIIGANGPEPRLHQYPQEVIEL